MTCLFSNFLFYFLVEVIPLSISSNIQNSFRLFCKNNSTHWDFVFWLLILLVTFPVIRFLNEPYSFCSLTWKGDWFLLRFCNLAFFAHRSLLCFSMLPFSLACTWFSRTPPLRTGGLSFYILWENIFCILSLQHVWGRRNSQHVNLLQLPHSVFKMGAETWFAEMPSLPHAANVPSPRLFSDPPHLMRELLWAALLTALQSCWVWLNRPLNFKLPCDALNTALIFSYPLRLMYSKRHNAFCPAYFLFPPA